MSYVAQYSNGSVRLHTSKEAALRHEARLPERVGIVAVADVNGLKHYRGRIPACGILFTSQDVSLSQLLGLLHYEEVL